MCRRFAAIAARHELVSPRISTASGFDRDDDLPDRLGGGGAGGAEIVIRRAQIEVLEEDLIELVVVVLAGVDNDVIGMPVERGHDA